VLCFEGRYRREVKEIPGPMSSGPGGHGKPCAYRRAGPAGIV